MDKSLFNEESLFLNLLKYFTTLLLFFLYILYSIFKTIRFFHLNFHIIHGSSSLVWESISMYFLLLEFIMNDIIIVYLLKCSLFG